MPVDQEPFINQPVDVTELPELSEEAFLPLDPSYLRVRWIGDAIFAAVVVVATIVVSVVTGSFIMV